MFQSFLKNVVLFHRAQPKAPNFLLVYAIIWLICHHQFFISLFTSSGSFSSKINTAITETDHQYILTLLLTGLFFIARLVYFYLAQKANALIEEEGVVENKLGHDQVFTENKDVIRLIALLEESKEKLALAKTKEIQLQQEKTVAINTSCALQAELDEVNADLIVITQQYEQLKENPHVAHKR
ncbi:hypothetical protein [Thalassotalea hakodatensis]|uniref:hypothetical protein n=1 Tax=Thalassotalea hakodatensis TaxID=3030492 RepID=UPI0025725255|nr:hypothetical protein [Thalassotalea hakodatensis]